MALHKKYLQNQNDKASLLYERWLPNLDLNKNAYTQIFCCFGDKTYKLMKQRQYGLECPECLETEVIKSMAFNFIFEKFVLPFIEDSAWSAKLTSWNTAQTTPYTNMNEALINYLNSVCECIDDDAILSLFNKSLDICGACFDGTTVANSGAGTAQPPLSYNFLMWGTGTDDTLSWDGTSAFIWV